jgi:hypothetical protein
MKAILMLVVVLYATPDGDNRTVAVPWAFFDNMVECESKLQAVMDLTRPYAKKRASANLKYVKQSATCRDLSDVDYAPKESGT